MPLKLILGFKLGWRKEILYIMTNVDRSCIMGILGNECFHQRPRKTLSEAPWLGLSQGKLLTSAELVKKLLYCTNMQCTALMVSNVHSKKTKNICPFSIVIRRQIPNCKTGRRWIRRIGQRLKGCGSFRVSSGRVWLTPTLENQWLDADKNPPRGFSFRYTSGAAPGAKTPNFFCETQR